MSDRLVQAVIDLKAYTHNLQKIRENLKPETKIMAVVKANAYGHGIEGVARSATDFGVDYLGVVSLGELKRIRKAGIGIPTMILNYLDSASFEEAIDNDATITVMDPICINELQQSAKKKNKTVKVHLKIDTGMHRAGCNPDEALSLAKLIVNSNNLDLEGIFTHLAESESHDPSFTTKQLKIFSDSVLQINSEGINPPIIHCANSAATISLPDTHFNMVRPGLATYGLNPFDESHPKYNYVAQNFKPVLSLKTVVVLIREIELGESVGYNRRWTAERKSKIAVIPVGYGDGFRRTPNNAGKVLVRGQFANIIGSVSMDQTVIDITDIPNVNSGDEVIILGVQEESSITADDIAKAYETINYEVVTALLDRIDRVYKN